MANIPLSPDLGQGTPQPQRTPTAEAPTALADAAQRAGQTLSGIADDRMQQIEQMGRAKAANALLDHEIAVKTAAGSIKDGLATGQLSYTDAAKAYQGAVSQIEVPKIDGLDPAAAEQFNSGIKRINAMSGLEIDGAAQAAQRQDYKAQAGALFDKLGKLAGMPGADIPAILGQADAARSVLQNAGLPSDQIDKTLQDFKDQTWAQDAVQKSMGARDSIPALEDLAHQLSDPKGFYIDKLDTNKRDGVLRSVQARIDVLRNRLQHQQDLREAKAGRAIDTIDRQISSGVPATPDMWANWADLTKGTSYADDFKQRVEDELQTQDVLRKPIDQQVSYIQQKQQELMNGGGTLRDKANLDRLGQVVSQNVKQLQNDPLLFLQNRTGQNFQPLDVSQLLQPNGADQLRAQLEDRMAAIRALRTKYGESVQIHPLLPQEVKFLNTALDKASPDQQAMIFKQLHAGLGGNTTAYVAAMQQIAPDAPVRAMAGMIAGKQQQITLEHNWLSSDVVANSGDVAHTLLVGEGILNKSKAQKAADGKSTGFPIPQEKDFQTVFTGAVGDAFAGNPQAYDLAMQAVRSYYTGKAAQDGDVSGVIDGRRLKQAITAVLGETADVNGARVFAPWGMSASHFQSRAHVAMAAVAKEQNLPEGAADQLRLRNVGDGAYLLTDGMHFLTDKTGQPVTINIGG
jgi:hypothetical protein